MNERFNGRFSKGSRIEAVKLVVEGGMSAYGASRHLSPQKATLENWVRQFKARKLVDIGGHQCPLT